MTWTSAHPLDLVPGDAVRMDRGIGSRLVVLSGRLHAVSTTDKTATIEWAGRHGKGRCDDMSWCLCTYTWVELNSTNLRTNPDLSPTVRTVEGGRAFLLKLLHDACGGDADRLGETCDPFGEPWCLGPVRAGDALADASLVREWMVRQLDGRLAVRKDARRLRRTEGADPEVQDIMLRYPGCKVIDVRLRRKGEDDDEDGQSRSTDRHADIPY